MQNAFSIITLPLLSTLLAAGHAAAQTETPQLDTGLAVSGLWFDPASDGEGFNVIQSEAGTTLYFYGYDTAGQQLWLVSNTVTEPLSLGEPRTFDAYRAQDGDFDAPAPSELLEPWGSISVTIGDCDNATFELLGDDGAKVSQAVRLAGIDGHFCPDQRVDDLERFGLAGLWFDPERDGEGFNVIQSDAGTTVYFYGYDDGGEALWLVSETLAEPLGAGDARLLSVFRGTGGTFDAPIPGADLDRWGTLIIVGNDCGDVRFELDGADGFKRADASKLAGVRGNDCSEPEVRVTADGVEFVRTPDQAFEGLPEWPYPPNYVEIDGMRQAYVDAGPATGPVVLLLHGQPSWSYLYRKMIPVLSEAGYRVIAMDHLGLGRSDKPIDIEAYSYLGHADRLERFIEALDLRDINLFVQDWGSLIGLRVAGLHPDWFATIAVGNGTLPVIPAGVEVFPTVEEPDEVLDLESPYGVIPDQQVNFYDGCDLLFPRDDNSYFGVWMEYAMKGISFRASETLEANTWFDLPPLEEAAYDAPFPSRRFMAGIRAFPSLINETPGVNQEAEAGLLAFERPFLTIWGANDAGALGACETQQYFIDNVPGAAGQPHVRLPEASHFLQDDQGEEIARRLVDFYGSNGIGDDQ